jgi:hypothetical protein
MTRFKILASVLALSALLLSGTAACSLGGPDARPGSQSGTDQERALKFAQCMREHGVDMPDSGDGTLVTGGGADTPGSLGGSAGAVELPDADGEAYQACREFLPNGGEPRKLTAAELEQAVRFAQCMRAHGLDYPDPSAEGAQQAFGVPMDDSAAMQRFDEAARACDAAASPAPTK